MDMTETTEADAMMADGLFNTVREAAERLYGDNQVYPCDDVKRMAAEITRLRAENERLRAAMQWRPITDNALPRDGSWFVICCDDDPNSIEACRYDPYMSFRYEEAENGLYRRIEYPVSEWSGSNMLQATHWMPLQPPPRPPAPHWMRSHD